MRRLERTSTHINECVCSEESDDDDDVEEENQNAVQHESAALKNGTQFAFKLI